MIVRVVRMTFAPEFVTDFQKVFESRKHLIASFEGCCGVKLLRDIHQPGVFFTISEWQDENCLNNYRQSELFRQTWSEVKQWFAAPPLAHSLQTH